VLHLADSSPQLGRFYRELVPRRWHGRARIAILRKTFGIMLRMLLSNTQYRMIVIEHNLDVIRNADWIVDMGPEGGYKGGTVLFQGTPRDLLTARNSLTARYLS
jgi:ABC-type multidrug transport system fused ATPase/permease subunit